MVCLFLLHKMGFREKINSTESVRTATSTKGTHATTSVKSYTQATTGGILQKDAGMSIAGVLKYTNAERVTIGLKPLTLNKKLSNSAVAKIDDMFTLQYFEHTSPSGKTAADLVRVENYNFQSVGENLALGDFGTDKKLVEAWMNSPLHKKNILNPKFTEIGIAVAKGTYKGDTQWLAVQHFGKPTPDCAAVSLSLKSNIDSEKIFLEGEEKELQKMANTIESDPEQNTPKEFLEMYNGRVAAYNRRLGSLRDMIKEYNTKVEDYNICVAS